MTVATQESSRTGSTKRPPGRLAPLGGAANPWRRLWQVPLLLAGITCFGIGVRTLVRTIRPVPFDQQARGVRTLIDAGEYAKAIEQINVLGRFYTRAAEQGELQILAGDVHYFAQKKQLDEGGGVVRLNEQRIEAHYAKAVAWGITPTPAVYERWGEAALALGDAKTAVAKLEAALDGWNAQGRGSAAADVPEAIQLIRRHGREMVLAYLELQDRQRALDMVAKVLAADRQAAAAATQPVPSELDERVWALCQQIEIALAGAGNGGGASAGADRESVGKAVDTAQAVVREWQQHAGADDLGRIAEATGRVLVWIGRAELELGETEAAQRDLTLARQHFVLHHLDDARASVLLARIAQARGAANPGGADLARAGTLFGEVAAEQAGTSVWAAARLGRAEVAVMQGAALSPEVLADYQCAVDAVKPAADGGAPAPIGKKAEMVDVEGVRASLRRAFERASESGRLSEALAALSLESELGVNGRPDYWVRLAATQERRGIQILAESDKVEGASRAQGIVEGRAMLLASAADYLKHGRMTTLEDEVSGASLWKAAELFDRGGDTNQAIAIYEELTRDRPRDGRVPEGLLALGRLYESQVAVAETGGAEGTAATQPGGEGAGRMDYLAKAIAVYERNIQNEESRNTPAAYASAVNAARCYGERAALAATPQAREEAFAEAEKKCLWLIQDNRNLQPAAREFREGLRALAELYFARGQWKGAKPRWADAIYRLEELDARYPDDAGKVRTLFLLGESYRGSAAEIEAASKAAPVDQQALLEAARGDRLARAADYYAQVIGMLDSAGAQAGGTFPGAGAEPGGGRKNQGLDEVYLRTSFLRRADCFYQRGDFAQAIKLYDQAAARFSDEVTAVEAYVQIVNGYLALNQPAQAAAAAERGQWLLKRMPDTAFAQAIAGQGAAGRTYYEKMLAVAKP